MRRLKWLFGICVSFVYLWGYPVQAQTIEGGSISFHVTHKFKEADWKVRAVDGENRNVDGSIFWDNAAPLDTTVNIKINMFGFGSANELRDSHMIEAAEAYLHPYATWEAVAKKVISDKSEGSARTIVLAFAGPFTAIGRSASLEASVTIRIEGEKAKVSSDFSFDLGNHMEKLPSLMGFKIANEIPVTVRLEVRLPPPPKSATSVEPSEEELR